MTIANVLLVDDEIRFVENMAKRLMKRNLVVKTAFSGQETLDELAKSDDGEAVIPDVEVPGMDGIETLLQWKDQSKVKEASLDKRQYEDKIVEARINESSLRRD